MSELKVHASMCEIERMVQTEEIRSAFVKRLKQALASAGVADWGAGVRLSEKTETTPKAAGKWLNAESMPGRSNMIVIAEWLGVRTEWLAHGEGAMRADDAEEADTAKEDRESNVIVADFSRNRLRDGEIDIPQYDVRAAMGSGQAPADYIETIRNVVLHESYLQSQGVSYTKASNLAIITGWGQSMEGTISDGDPVIVDRGVLEFAGDGVYVFTWDGLLYIKRLQKESADTFDMISDNPKHKDRVIAVGEITIHARVLLAWSAKRL